MRSLLLAIFGLCVFAAGRVTAMECPFCSAVSQSLRQEMKSMDTVVLAEIVSSDEREASAEFKVVEVIKGEQFAKPGQLIQAAFGVAVKGTKFLIMGVDPPDLLWNSPMPVSEKAVDYIKAINALPESLPKQLAFYLQHLESSESLLARDAYEEFAQAPYPDVAALKEQLDRKQLLTWIQDSNLPSDRKRLYLVMLGICGQKDDAVIVEKMLRSDDPQQRVGLDAMIACYVTLRGADGLKLIDELFLENKKCPYPDTYATIMALRFHGTDGNVVEKPRVLKSMHLILQRPELADLVIPDLARWEDWSQIDTLVTLFKTADDKSSWVRVPVINYLRACPLPEAASQLSELEKLDPAAFKRATSFFPVPQPASSSTKRSSSYIAPIEKVRSYASLPIDLPIASSTPLGTALSAHSRPNLLSLASVFALATTTVTLAMWLAITGAGRHSFVALAWAGAATRSGSFRA